MRAFSLNILQRSESIVQYSCHYSSYHRYSTNIFLFAGTILNSSRSYRNYRNYRFFGKVIFQIFSKNGKCRILASFFKKWREERIMDYLELRLTLFLYFFLLQKLQKLQGGRKKLDCKFLMSKNGSRFYKPIFFKKAVVSVVLVAYY